MLASARHVLFLALAISLVPAVALDSGAVRAGTWPTVDYVLLQGSTFQQGCFEPCLCPLLEPQPMQGTFKLEYAPFMGPLETVAVTHVDWTVPSLNIQIAGAGTYVRAGSLQRLSLDLQIDGGPVQSFDSGFVEGAELFPLIDLTVDMNDLYCYDIVLSVRAEPVDGSQLLLAVASSLLVWTPLPGADAYDVVSGNLTDLRATDGDFGEAVDSCLTDELAETSLPYSLVVDPEQALWFLVRASGGTYDSNGPSQSDSRDPGIAASTAACP